jgi:DNA-binding IclR family transcriptional regulator
VSTRRRGYGERHGETFPKTGATAVPVMHGERAMCGLNISFIASALTPAEAVAKYLGLRALWRGRTSGG